MKMGKVETYINDHKDRGEPLLMILIDPCDHASPDAAAKTAKAAEEGGSQLILVGGSIGAQGALMEETTKQIKEAVGVPVNIFPGNNASITSHADSIYFYSLLNSRNAYWTTMAQTTGAPVIKRMGIEPLPTGYIVVEPGGTVGWVADVNLVPRNRPQIAAALAMAGEYMGNRLMLTDSGSAPEEGHMPLEMIKAVRQAISIPYIVGGGVRTPEEAKSVIKAGADAIQVGTAIENNEKVRDTASKFLKAMKEGKK
ncbi:geranylgeranylglyceryl/heptaprenylglyceryl phosphate synthase [archaeon]